MKKVSKLFMASIVVIGSCYLLLFVISGLYSPQAEHVPFLNDDRVISPEVEKYRPLIAKYAAKNGIASYTDLLVAVAMQESRGKSADVMQSAESRGRPKGSIRDPEQSIATGVRYFKQALDRSGGDMELALQSYNFGIGFADFVRQRGRRFTPALARRFSRQKAHELGWRRYGDPDYVAHVMRYYHNEQQKRSIAEKEK